MKIDGGAAEGKFMTNIHKDDSIHEFHLSVPKEFIRLIKLFKTFSARNTWNMQCEKSSHFLLIVSVLP